MSIASSNPSSVADAVVKIKSESAIPDARVKGFTVDLSHPDIETRLEKLLTDATADDKLDHIVLTAGRASMRPIARTDRDYILGQA